MKENLNASEGGFWYGTEWMIWHSRRGEISVDVGRPGW